MNIQQSAKTLSEFLSQISELGLGDQYSYKYGTTIVNALRMGGPSVRVEDLVIPNSEVRNMLSTHVMMEEPYGYEMGRINKSTPTITTYTVALMLLNNGQLIAIRPHRNIMSFTYSGQTRRRFTTEANLSTGHISEFHPKAVQSPLDKETEVTYGKVINKAASALKRPSNCTAVLLLAVEYDSSKANNKVLGVIGATA